MRSITLVLILLTFLSACSAARIRTFELVGKDLRFNPDFIQVNEGEIVRINFSNPDIVPHLIELPAFGQHIALIPGGEFTLQFLADRTGTFPFVCSVPGHEEAGMVGVFIVE